MTPADEYDALCEKRRRRARTRVVCLVVAWLTLQGACVGFFFLLDDVGYSSDAFLPLLCACGTAWLLGLVAATAAAWIALSNRGPLAGGWVALGCLPWSLLLVEMLFLTSIMVFGL